MKNYANKISLLALIEKHNAMLQKRIDIDYTFSTFQKYDILYKKVSSYIQHQYGMKDILLKDIKHSFAVGFDLYLRGHDLNKHNTVVKYIINLKKVFNQAVFDELIPKNPIATFKATYKDVDRFYLSLSEIQLIESQKFKAERLERTKNLFIFQCYTGLAYSDMSLLTENHISLGIDDQRWIFMRRKKTNIRCAIPILPKASLVLLKYKSHPGNYLLPCYAIQKYNEYLHEIAKECKINKPLTSHVGRRTFATTIALANGVSIETVSKILGHTSTKITQQYAVVTDHKISIEMNKLKAVLNKPNSI